MPAANGYIFAYVPWCHTMCVFSGHPNVKCTTWSTTRMLWPGLYSATLSSNIDITHYATKNWFLKWRDDIAALIIIIWSECYCLPADDCIWRFVWWPNSIFAAARMLVKHRQFNFSVFLLLSLFYDYGNDLSSVQYASAFGSLGFFCSIWFGQIYRWYLWWARPASYCLSSDSSTCKPF